jgi:hypothetical protein
MTLRDRFLISILRDWALKRHPPLYGNFRFLSDRTIARIEKFDNRPKNRLILLRKSDLYREAIARNEGDRLLAKSTRLLKKITLSDRPVNFTDRVVIGIVC